MGREIARVEALDGSGKFGTESFLHGEMDLSPLAALRGYLTNDFPMWAWRVEEIPRVTPEGVEKVDKVLVRDGRPGVWRMRPGGVLERRVEGRPVQAAVGNMLAAWLQQIPAFGAVGWEKPKGGGQVVMTLPTDDRKEGRELYLKIQSLAKGEFGKTKRAKTLTDEERETLSNEAAKTIKALQVSAGAWLDSKKADDTETLSEKWVEVNEPLGEFEAPPDNRGKIWRVDPKLKAKQGELLAQLDGMKKMVRFSPIDALKREVKFKTLAKLTEAVKSGDAKARAHAQQALKNGAYTLGEYTGRDVMLDDEEDDQHSVRYKKISSGDVDKVYEDYKRNRNGGVLISNRGGTGLDFHADVENDNPLPVLQTVLNFGEAVDDEVQKLGRGLRTGRVGSLEFVLFRIGNFVTEMRQTGAIGAKLGEMGAMQSGDRHQSAGGEVVRTEDDFLDEYFVDAFKELVKQLNDPSEDNPHKEFPFSGIQLLRDQMGYETGSGDDYKQLEIGLEKPTPNNILNRLASVSGEPGSGWELAQNYVLQETLKIRDKIVADIPPGEREGMKTLTAETISLRALDPKTGAETGGPRRQPLNLGDNAYINQVTVVENARAKDWRMANLMSDGGKPYRRVWRTTAKGDKEPMIVWEDDRMMAGPRKGASVTRWWTVFDGGIIPDLEYDPKEYPNAKGSDWQDAWDEAVMAGKKIRRERFFVSGWRANLALMEEMKGMAKTGQGSSVFLVRPTTASGDEEFIGREIPRGNKNTGTRAAFDAFMAKYTEAGGVDEKGDTTPLAHAAAGGMVVVDGMKGIGLTTGKGEAGRKVWIVPGQQPQNKVLLIRAGFEYSTRRHGAHWWADAAGDAAENLLGAFPNARALDAESERDKEIGTELGLLKGRASFPEQQDWDNFGTNLRESLLVDVNFKRIQLLILVARIGGASLAKVPLEMIDRELKHRGLTPDQYAGNRPGESPFGDDVGEVSAENLEKIAEENRGNSKWSRQSFPRADSMLERFGLPGGTLTLRQDANAA